MLPGELQVFRERANDLEAQLAKSPKKLKELQHQQGHECSVLQVHFIYCYFLLLQIIIFYSNMKRFFTINTTIQKEIQRVTEAYKKLKEEAIETSIEADKINMEAVRALATWEIYMDYISGTKLLTM